MTLETSQFTRRGLFKALDIEHLNDEEFQLLSECKLNKDDLSWAVLHLSECEECCFRAPRLTAEEIKDALTDAPYGRENLTEQVIEYYFLTLEGKNT